LPYARRVRERAGPARAGVVWQAHDDRPIAEPAVDDGRDHVRRDGT